MAQKALDGIKVLDFTRVLAGPYATMMLKNMGADVIKVEAPYVGDDSRAFGPYKNGESCYFLSINRGKKSIAVDLKSSEGKEAIISLVKQVDFLIENFKPGTMENLGLGYDYLSKINPRLIYVSISGFGHTGPYSGKPAYDMIVQAFGGIMSITGEPNGVPVRVGTSIGDITAGIFGVVGALQALYTRVKTGLGQKVDIAMLDCQLAILENAIIKYSVTGQNPQPLGLRHPSITPFSGFKTKDSWVIMAVGNNKLWEKFCMLVEKEEWITNPSFDTNEHRNENVDAITKMLDEIFIKKSTKEWVDLLSANNIPVSPINNIADLFNDPQIAARNMLVSVEQEDVGKIIIAGNPIKMSSIPSCDELPTEPAPYIGEHTAEILKEYLGYNDKKIDNYIKKFL